MGCARTRSSTNRRSRRRDAHRQATGAVSKDMIQLQEQVTQLLQGQRDLRSAIDTHNATLRTLVQQSLDATNQLNSQMGILQKSVQEATANSSSRIDTMSTQTQGLSDNMQDVQARVAKLGQQMNDIQVCCKASTEKISGGASSAQNSYSGAPGPASAQSAQPNPGAASQPPQAGNPVPAMPAMSADTLYQMPCAISALGNTISPARSSAITSRIFPLTIWLPMRSFIWAKYLMRREITRTRLRSMKS